MGHIPLEQPDEEPIEQLLVIHRAFFRQFRHDGTGLLLRRVILAEEQQILPVQIQQHLGVRRPGTVDIIPIKGNDAEGLKALKGLDLALVEIGQHLRVHPLRRLRHAGKGQHRLHGFSPRYSSFTWIVPT